MSFEAKYHGRCAECVEGIEPGDQVDYDADDALVHVHCDTQADTYMPPPRGERKCLECNLIHAGECI